MAGAVIEYGARTMRDILQMPIINNSASLTDINTVTHNVMWNNHYFSANLMRLLFKKPFVKYVGDPGLDSLTVESIHRADLVIYNSPRIQEYITQKVKPPKTQATVLIPPWANLYPYKRDWPDRKPNSVLYFNLLSRHKGLTKFIAHAKDNPDQQHNAYGRCEPDMEPIYKAAERQLPNFKYCGVPLNEEKPAIFGAHEYYFFSPVWLETFGITILEAQYSGCKMMVNGDIGLYSWKWNLDKDEDEIKARLFDMPEEFWSKVLPALGLQAYKSGKD
jgi:glycosyltransferase involved in cell wall biosynthesis